MAVLALISDEKTIDLVLSWASAFASARCTPLTVVCWTHSPVASTDGSEHVSQDLVQAARDFFSQAEPAEQPEVIGVSGPSESTAAIGVALQQAAELIVAAANAPTGTKGTTNSTNLLLKQSPCNTVVLFGDLTRSITPQRIFVGATDNMNDGAALFLASRLANNSDARVTLARAELEPDQEGLEVGRRELQHLIRDAGVDDNDRLVCQVFQTGDFKEVTTAMDEHDLVLLGANCPLLPTVLELTKKPTVAVIQRAPPLRPWQKAKQTANWKPRLSPADYADLIGGLRRGSRLGADFITMLSLAAIVASIGLLQDSPAVVIGSMLLAPLMTPMIGCGLALAQANQKLGNTALKTVAVGLLCTLAISFFIGLIAPGAELTPQIYARGEPTVLDLVVALASGAAAAYALARPNLVGSIAGVAIATALVPPLCSVGLSLAFADMTNAKGAALLFVTNFLVIVLAAAFTFRLIGITAEQAKFRQKFWVFRIAGILGIGVILVCVPLQFELLESLVKTKPQPRAYPLTQSVTEALEDRVASEPGVHLITAGRPSSHLILPDVVLVLGATGEICGLGDQCRTILSDEHELPRWQR
jgi:uncharacterized hydrophobic protein (TIGR00271 family)